MNSCAEEVGDAELVGVVGEVLFADAVVGRLAVFEALAAGGIGKGEEEVVVVVVVRLVEGVGFADEVGDLGEGGGTKVAVAGFVGDDINEVGGLDLRGERELVKVETGIHGRVFQLLDRSDGELVRIGGAGAGDAAFGFQGGADSPSLGDGDRGLDGDLRYRNVSGIEQQTFPLKGGQLGGLTPRVDEVEMGVEEGDAFRDGQVVLKHVDVVATPLQGFAVRGEDDAGDGVDDGRGAMGAGDPLRRDEGNRAGFDGDVDLGVVELAGGLGEVGCDLNGRLRVGCSCADAGEACQKSEREDGVANGKRHQTVNPLLGKMVFGDKYRTS